MQHTVLALALGFILAPAAAAEWRQARIDDPAGVETIASAGSLDELARLAKPLAVWNERDMLWVRDGDGTAAPVFVLNRAFWIGDRREPRWALVRPKPDVDYVPELDGDHCHTEVTVVERAPRSDGGAPSHALRFASSGGGGTLYRVRWGSEPTTGSGLYYTLRDVFVLRRPDGRWTFVGEGASVVHGRGSPGKWFNEDLEYRLAWTDHPRRPVEITATFSHTNGSMSENDPPAKRDLTFLREGTLDPATKLMRWGGRAYVTAGARETFDDVVGRVAEWKLGYHWDHTHDRRPALRAVLRGVMAAANPRSAAKATLAAGERVLVPAPGELAEALKGHPATRPARKRN